MQRYITWTRKKVNDNLYADPNTNDRVNIETNWQTTFYETPYQINDWRFISYVDYPDTTTEEEITYYLWLEPEFNFTLITEEEANTLLSELWDVSVSNFEFKDNRPSDLF